MTSWFLAWPRLPRTIPAHSSWPEDAHAPVLLDLLAADTSQVRAADRTTRKRERVRLHRERARLQATLTHTLDLDVKFRLETQRDALDRELGIIELMTLSTLKNRTAQRLSAREQRSLTRDVGPIVMYYVAPQETLAFVLRSGRPLGVVRIAASRNELRREVQTLRHDLGNPLWQQQADTRARALFERLLGPLADLLANSPRLTIIPHGPLHQLPFEALIIPDASSDGDSDNNDNGNVCSSAGTSPWRPRCRSCIEFATRNQPTPAEHGGPFVALAAGQGLQFPDREVRDVAAIFGRDRARFHQADATFATYRKQAPTAAIC